VTDATADPNPVGAPVDALQGVYALVGLSLLEPIEHPPWTEEDGASVLDSAPPVNDGTPSLPAGIPPPPVTVAPAPVDPGPPNPSTASDIPTPAAPSATAAPPLEAPAYALDLVFDDGVVRFGRGCLTVGEGRYTIAQGGQWSFDAGTLDASASCPGEVFAAQVGRALTTLEQATTVTADLAIPSGISLTGPAGDVRLDLSNPNVPGVPAPLDSPADPAVLEGVWVVSSLVDLNTSAIPGTAAESSQPWYWPIVIEDGQVALPEGCNNPSVGDYLADGEGHWAFAGQSVLTAMGCQDERSQVEAVYRALTQATSWAPDGPGKVDLTGPDQAVTLSRGE
jgi:hypothetical protein